MTFRFSFTTTILFIVLIFVQIHSRTDSTFRTAGFRASRILSSYPNNQFPSPAYWSNTGNAIASKFSSTSPAAIWIVSLYISNGVTQLNFPSPGGSYPNINFISSDKNEEYLTHFDNEGIKVWLQVEPGAASIDTLIHLVLTRYKHHPCVIGFGIDVEWYNTQQYSGGKKVTDAEAARWEAKIKSIDSNYTLFLKHYGQNWMPPAYRGDILFVDDSQEFANMTALINEFKLWGLKFSPNPVAFQYGYRIDKVWWSLLPDPMKTIGQSLLNNVSNCSGLFWVDFTINDIFPITNVKDENIAASEYELCQNYPNPFNPSTVINFQIPVNTYVTLKVFDVIGNEVATLVNEEKPSGYYEIEWHGGGLASGVYFYSLISGNFRETKKMLLVK
ncbi:MAG: T9SS type A sorting domain-containing protein [Ignavibacteriaceae bacterium]